MTGPLAKADALLSARLAPWVELSARQAPAGAEEEAAPPVARAPRVDNDLLLPARANLQLQAAAQPRAALPAAAAHAADAGSTAIALSSAARAIFALSSDMHAGQAAAVRGSAPLWPAQRQVPAAQAFASALSRQFSESGLFYESHLAEFASGARSLAQMQREPQAGLAQGRAVQEADPDGPQPRQPSGVLPMAAAPTSAVAMPAPSASAVAALMAAMPLQQAPQQAGQKQETAAAQTETGPVRMQGVPAVSVDGALLRLEHAAPAAHAQSAAAADSATQASAADALPAAAAAVVHPQAAALVHQQLDLLAGAMFRWSGEAWPGVPMEWTVQEEGGRRHSNEDEGQGPVQWATTLALDLPRLGAVKVALKLDGQNVHARLAANDEPTTDRLRAGVENLTRRMSQAGLELQSLALGPEEAAP